MVILPFPLPEAEINLPIILTASDQDGNNLSVKSNFPIEENKVVLSRKDLIGNSHLQIIAEAEDNWGQKIICDFTVEVQGW